MAKSDITKRPKKKAGDVSHAIVKAGLSFLPPAAELFSFVVTPSLEKRRDKWIESIVEAFKDLEERVDGFDVENLKENEKFITVLMQASQAAIRNHQQEKLEALRNAVLNAALPSAPEEDLQLMFLNFVDFLTPRHLRMLKMLNEFKVKLLPRQARERLKFIPKSTTKPAKIDQKLVQELEPQKDFYDQVLKDLRIRGLLEYSMTDESEFTQKIIYAQPTNLGKRLLAFISSPK